MGIIGATWGIGGVLLLLSSAVWRLSPLALEAFSHEFLWYHWMSLALVVVLMAFAEGYRGFQQRFSPRVASRARYLRQHPRPLFVVLGPFFCMGYFHATKRRKFISISLTLGIIALIIMVRLLPQPWRGIIDAGVVIGLIWGIASLVFFVFRAFTSDTFSHPPEVPANAE